MTERSEHVRVERHGHVGVVTLARPDKLNALTHEMMDALPVHLEELASDPDVRCVVLTGEGRGFCAGGDLATAREAGEASEDEVLTRFVRRQRAAALLHEMPKPTVAAIGGVAAGAGLSLALACDLRVASTGAKFTTAFAKVGFSGDYGVSYFLPRVVGPARARELLMLSDVVDAAEALRIGLVQRLVEPESLATEALALGARLAAGPTLAYGYLKENVALAEHLELRDVLDAEARATVALMRSADNREALAAFEAKRPPIFRGR